MAAGVQGSRRRHRTGNGPRRVLAEPAQRRERGGAGEALEFTSDPANPVPTVGGANLVLDAGPYDQRPLLERGDLLAFASPVLTNCRFLGNAATASIPPAGGLATVGQTLS